MSKGARIPLSSGEASGAAGAPAATQAPEPPSEPDEGTGVEEWAPGAENRDVGWYTGRPRPRALGRLPLQAEPGVTALAGQVLALNGRPLANVSVALEHGRETTTDRFGRFLLGPAPAGHHVLTVDGAGAGAGARRYGLFQFGVELREGETSELPFTVWMPKLSSAGAQRISTPTSKKTVLTTPRIPGLEVHIPAGVTVTDARGQPVRELSITPIPVDRPPFPLPRGVEVPIYFSVQPGGARISGPGARIVYPNYTRRAPGTRVRFWHYKPEHTMDEHRFGGGWYVYGRGTVTPDGKQIVPDPGVTVREFTGAMIDDDFGPPDWARKLRDFVMGGDPVDLGTGLFLLEKTDLVLPDVLPVALTRVYRQNDGNSYAFGIGTNHPYDLRLWSNNNYLEADLILPDGARVHFNRTSAGTGYMDAVYESATPGPFYKSKLAWNGKGWDLTTQNGTVYVFGDTAPLSAIRDRYGNQITITRAGTNIYGSPVGNITQLTSPSGRWIKLSYDGANRITRAEDNSGRAVTYAYDASGRLQTVTDPKGGLTDYTYDASHRMLTIKDARRITFLTNEYDANGRVSKQTQPDGTTYQFAYTLDAGKVTRTDLTDPSGFVRRVDFNADGYPVGDTHALGRPEEQQATYERQASTNLTTAVVDALGRRTTYAYDGWGNVSSETRLAGTADAVTTTFTYEPVYHQLATVTDPLQHTTTLGYGARGKLVSVRDPLGHETTLAYNGAGQPVSVTNALSKTTSFEYDLNELVAVTDPLARKATRFFDAAGRMLRTSDPLGAVTRYTYDALNQATKATDALGGETIFAYDANGNLLSLTDARGKQTVWAYDDMDRATSRRDPLLRSQLFEYDQDGNLVEATDRRGQVTSYGYDALGRATFAGFGETGSPATYESTVEYGYDDGDRLTSAVDSQTGTVTLAYDGLDRLASETNPRGSLSYGYDAAGRRTSMTVAGQTATTYGYDDADRLTSITKGTSTVGFAYDDADRRTSLTLPNGVVQAYGYDDADQLVSIAYRLGQTTLGELAYGYDPGGRRVTLAGSWARTGLPAAVASASYDDANRLTNWGGSTLGYDQEGNLTSDGTLAYVWDARGRLASLSGGGSSASFAYDPLGRRSSLTLNGQASRFLHDGANLVQEQNAGGTPTANLLTGLAVDDTLQRTDGAGARSFLTDALGSTLALADSAGAVQTEYSYEPFGKPTVSGQTSGNRVQYTGRDSDGTGLQYNRARYYSPTLQRFVSEDPMGFGAGDPNLYAYVANKPIMATDPSGNCGATGAVGATVGAVGGGLGAYATGQSGWDIVRASAVGGGAGLVTGCTGILTGVAGAGLLGAGTDLLTQAWSCLGQRKCEINIGSVVGAGVGGSLASFHATKVVPMHAASAGLENRAVIGTIGTIWGFPYSVAIGVTGTKAGDEGLD